MTAEQRAAASERPILFSAPMVRACRREVDPKTQTRRTSGLKKINAEPDAWEYCYAGGVDSAWHTFTRMHVSGTDDVLKIRCPYGVAGDRLWTRECFSTEWTQGSMEGAVYRADELMWDADYRWRPSIHMPRSISRDTLDVISVRPERLHCVTESDAVAEGIMLLGNMKDGDGFGVAEGDRDLSETARDAYGTLWEEINGPGSWSKNLWVWRVEFRRLSC